MIFDQRKIWLQVIIFSADTTNDKAAAKNASVQA